MHKLVPVEEAKTLFNEAKDWSVWRWLIEKKRARTTADAAWEALEACDEKVRAGWNEEWRQAYGHPKSRRYAALDDEVKAALERLYEDDEEAKQAHDAAEAQFDEADRRMSSSMACEGAQMAIDAWEMREKVIRKAEALARRK
jgi:maltose-binding protein MalE